MKRLICIFLCTCLALAAGGCAQDPVVQDPTEATGSTVVTAPPTTDPPQPEIIVPPIAAIAMPTVSETVPADDGMVLFTKTYQHFNMTLTDSKISALITADLQARLNVALSDAAEIEDAARLSYSPDTAWSPYVMEVSYTPTRIDRAVLSLFGNHLTYRGNIHPVLVTESVTYDLTTGRSLTLGDILAEDITGSAICEQIVEALAPRAQTDLYDDHQQVLHERFARNYEGLTDWYFSHTGLCFHFSPYDIAPYSSGTIIAEIPYEKLSGIIRQQFLPAEASTPTGSMYAEEWKETDSERFLMVVDVDMKSDGTTVLLHPDAAVADVRIESGSWSADGTMYIPASTVFAADSIEFGNAIAVTAGFSKDDPVLRLVYRSGDLKVSAIITYDTATDSIVLVQG